MSDDVDRLLRNYLVMMDHKDKHEFHLAERAAELEGLLQACRSKLLQQDALITARDEERSGLLAELDERKQHIIAMDNELTSLRTFNRSTRKLLVMDDATKFSLGEVLHVLCARLEDYGVVARAYQQQRQQSHDMRSAWEHSITTLETLHRNTMEEAFEASHVSAAEMLNNALNVVGVAHQERDMAHASTADAIERASNDAKLSKEAITAEMAQLRTHVDQLVGELTALRRERDGAVSQLSIQADVCRVLEGQRDMLLASLYKRATAALLGGTPYRRSAEDAGDASPRGLVGMRGELLAAAQDILNSVGMKNAQLTATVQTLQVVNDDLRHQLATASRTVKHEQKKFAQEKRAAEELHVTRAEAACQQIIDLRQQLSDAIARERSCQVRLREAQDERLALEGECRSVHDAMDNANNVRKTLEHDLKHKAREVHRLNTLLSELQESSAQLRDVLLASDVATARHEAHAVDLGREVTTWQHTAAEQRKHVAELQAMVAERTTHARLLSEEVAELRTRLTSEASLRSSHDAAVIKEHQTLQEDARELRNDLASARLDRDAARVELGITASQLRDARDKVLEQELHLATLRQDMIDARASENAAWNREREELERRAVTAERRLHEENSRQRREGAQQRASGKPPRSVQSPDPLEKKHLSQKTQKIAAHASRDFPRHAIAASSASSSSNSGGGCHSSSLRYGPTPSRPRDDDENNNNNSEGDASSLSSSVYSNDPDSSTSSSATLEYQNEVTRSSSSSKRGVARGALDGPTAVDLIHMIQSSMMQRGGAAAPPSHRHSSSLRSSATKADNHQQHHDELDELRHRLAHAEAARDFSINESARLREQHQMQLLMAAGMGEQR
jgi:hypothetical protein